MDAKQKALNIFGDLVNKMNNTLDVSYPYSTVENIELAAKECALICVDEIIAKHFDDWDSESEWWNEVKSEIEKF